MKKQISIQGKEISYRVQGKGDTVMLLHGFGETGDVWEKQVSYLQEDFTLIVPDLPGSGDSSPVEDMTMEGMATVVKQIFDAESTAMNRPPVLVGHSMGGYITLAFVSLYPDFLRAFGLFHSSAFADTEEKKETRRKGIAFIQEHGGFEFLKSSSPNLFSPATKKERPALIDTFISSLNNFSSTSLVSYYEAMMARPDRTTVLKTTSLPVLFVLGEFDNAIPLEDGLKQVPMAEKSYIHILHQSGHMGMLEETEKSNEILKKFLSET